jgi:hypothetical protein
MVPYNESKQNMKAISHLKSSSLGQAAAVTAPRLQKRKKDAEL